MNHELIKIEIFLSQLNNIITNIIEISMENTINTFEYAARNGNLENMKMAQRTRLSMEHV